MNKPYDVIKIDKNTKKIQTPNLLLTTRSFNVIGKISNFNNWKISLVGNGVDEISFDVHKFVNGKICPIWDDLVDLKIVQVMGFGNFEISVDYTDNTETVKSVHGKSLEVELSQIPLNDFHVNDDDAMSMKQTEYNAADFDENGNFIPTTFYNPKDKNHSLLHRVLKDKAQHWSIGEVTPYIAIDEEKQRELSSTFQRTYTCDGTSIYDFLTGDVAKESNVIFIFDTLHRKINCYSLCDCVDLETGDIYKGIGEDTTVFVSKRKLTNEITINSNKDNVKNCFRIEGGDDVITNMIGAVNMNGSNYIYKFADFQYNDMSKELVAKLKSYQEMISSQELQDEYYGYGDIKRFVNGTLTLNVRNEYEAILTLAICSSNNISVGSANIMTYINTPFWYVIDGKNGKELYVSNTKQTPLLYATTAYNTMGIYPKSCVQYDMLEYLESSMMPSVVISETTAEYQYAIMKNNLTSEDTVIGIYSCAKYSDTAFLGVTNNVVAMANVVIDARYKAEVIKNTTSYTKVDDHNYIWTGNIKITRVADETDYYPKTDDDSKLTFSVKISDDELTYTKQKIEKALSKGSMLDIDFDVAEMNETEIRNYFNRYSLNKLNGFQEGYNNCLSTLMSMRSDSDVKNTLYNSYKTRFNIVSELYTNRQSQVDNVNKTIFDLDIERSNFIDEKKLRLQDYLGDNLYKEFSAYRREDSYKNDNYISDGYSTAQCLERAKELLEVAQKEVKKACVLQRTVSCNLNNLFAVPEFEPLYDKLALFNYIRIRTEDEILKLRLIEVDFSGDSVDKIEVTFSEQIETVDSKTSDLESVLQQASTMATSYSSTILQAKKGEDARNKLLDLYYGGLNATNIMLSNNDHNEVTITSAGLIAKRMDDEGYYGDKQLRITGNGVYLTKDAWKNVEMAIGEVFFNGSWQYGVLAPLLVGKMIAGNNLVIQDENGTVKIDGNGITLDGGSIKWTTNIDASNINSKGNTLDKVISDYDDSIKDIISDISDLDDRVQTYSQSEDPSKSWKINEYESHLGDVWFDTTNNLTKIWTKDGDNYDWTVTEDANLKALATQKSTIYRTTTAPNKTVYPELKSGDLWVLPTDMTINDNAYKKDTILIYDGSSWNTTTTDSAENALSQLSDIANDGKITPSEKVQLKFTVLDIKSEYASIISECSKYDNVSYTNLATDYNNLINNVGDPNPSSGNPTGIFANINVTSTVTSSTFVGYFSAFYSSRDEVFKSLEDARKKYSVETSKSEIVAFQKNVLGANTTDITSKHVISPYIGGGYLYIAGDSGSVEINPKQEKKDYIGYSGDIFNVKNSSKTTVFNVSTSGQVTIRGGNSSNSIELDGKNGTIYTINGSHKSVLTSGKLYFYENNKNMMTVAPTAWNPKPDVKGTALHSEVDSKFISFGNKNSSSDTSYTTNLILNYGLNPYKISNDPSSGEIDKNVIIFGTTYHSSNVYFNNNSYIGSSSSNYNGIYVSDAIKSPRVYAGNYVHGDYALDVNGNAYLSSSITFGNGNNAYLNGITSGGICCSGSFGVNGGGYTGYALGVTGSAYISSNLVVAGNANLGSVTCSDLGLWVTTSGQRFSAKYCWTGSEVCFYINNDKWWYATGSFSDKRIKKNISSIPNLKDMYLALQPRQYNYIDNNIVGYESDKIHYGLIAQDTLEVMNSYGINYENQTLIKRNNTDMCTKNLVDDDYIYSIDYENLHAWHIAFSQQFYKEYNEKILQLEERLSELELELQQLKQNN